MPEVLTLRDAAERTGLSPAALARRVERGTLRAVLRDGKRRVPVAELERAGLLGEDGRTEVERQAVEVAELRRELAAARELTERVERAQAAEQQAHELTRAALVEEAAERESAAQRAAALEADLEAIAAGPIVAWRLRRRRRQALAAGAPCQESSTPSKAGPSRV